MKTGQYFLYGEHTLTVGVALDIARSKVNAKLSERCVSKIKKSREAVEDIVKNHTTVYGINTGFGPLCTTRISDDELKHLQHNLLRSHSVGVGEYIEDEISRLMLILKIHALARGYSGISPETIYRMIWFVEKNISPCVPSQGSVGASGDLAPLAHLFLPLIGLGKIKYQGKIYHTSDLYKQFNLQPLELGPKEGLALINGTQFIAAHAIQVVERLQNCLDHADIIAALNLEAMMGSVKPFDARLHKLRPYSGSQYVAERMRILTGDSEIVQSHKNCSRVQDPYSLRCIPQVHGASREAWLHLKKMLHIELNSVTDNPIIFEDNTAISGGNFHGQPLALPLDYVAVAASELGNISDRRIYLSLADKIEGLPKLLMKNTGLNSGFMIPQYTTAALVSENKSLCFPASADSIPTSMGQEDHVSMGSISARKTLRIIDNLEKILGIELFCAAQGYDFRKPLKSGILVDECYRFIRSKISFAENDRIFSEDMNVAISILKNKELITLTNKLAAEYNLKFKNESDELFGIY
ncbi:MAG: histidine ammonia-lyase [Bacteroidales bacterium]|nr:histidine ammonia-lyase [Bacteroidales bacterium]